MSIHKHAVSDPKPDISEKESLDDYPDEDDLYYWVEAVNDGNTLLGYRDWLESVKEEWEDELTDE